MRNHVSSPRKHVSCTSPRGNCAKPRGTHAKHVGIERKNMGIAQNHGEIARKHAGVALNHLSLALNHLRLAQTADQAIYLFCSYEHLKYTVKATATIPITASIALSVHSSRSLISCPRFNLPKKHPCTYNTAHSVYRPSKNNKYAIITY